jgi:hypothetical protein
MLCYVVVNRTRCCRKPICTECYLQVRVLDKHRHRQSTTSPRLQSIKHPPVHVYARPLSHFFPSPSHHRTLLQPQQQQVKKPRGHRHRHHGHGHSGSGSGSSSSVSHGSPCPYCNQKLSAVYGVEDEEKMAAQEAAYLKLYRAITSPPQASPAMGAGALEGKGKGAKEEGGGGWAARAPSPASSSSPSSSSAPSSSMLPGGLFARAVAGKGSGSGSGSASGGVAVAAVVPSGGEGGGAGAGAAASGIPVATVKDRRHIEGAWVGCVGVGGLDAWWVFGWW